MASQLGPKDESSMPMDSLERANLIKADQGHHEAEVSCGGEADLHKALIICKKNPGHRKFIPINDFQMHHLPPLYRDEIIYNYIRAEADLTVRLAVRHTSMARPETYPDLGDRDYALELNIGKPYPFFNHRGKDFQRFGTGLVWSMYRKSKENGDGVCPCFVCLSSPPFKEQWGAIYVETARHVVFDGEEALHTICELFFDTNDRRGVLSLWGVEDVVSSHINGDWCVFVCVTHDMDLFNKLEEMCLYRDDLRDKVNLKYMSYFSDAKITTNIPVFIVSHPHGCTKQVSVGEWIDPQAMKGQGDRERKITVFCKYTAATCPGSSGAKVLVLWNYSLYWYQPHHGSTGTSGVNMTAMILWIASHVWPEIWTDEDCLATALATLKFYDDNDATDSIDSNESIGVLQHSGSSSFIANS